MRSRSHHTAHHTRSVAVYVRSGERLRVKLAAMRRTGMVLGLFGLTLGLAACPSDDGEGSGTEGDTDGTTSGTMSSTSLSTSTTAMSTSSSSSSTTMEPTTEMMTESTTNVTDTDTDTDPGTTTGGEDCDTCVADNCGKSLGVCTGIKDCACWLGCTAEGGDEKMCAMECMGPPPDEFGDVLECIAMNCEDACLGGGSRRRKSTRLNSSH